MFRKPILNDMNRKAALVPLFILLLLGLILSGACDRTPPVVQPVPPVSAAFEITGLTVGPSIARVGEEVAITVEVHNTGDIEGSYTVELMVNDAIESEETVVVESGAREVVDFSFSPPGPGDYRICVDGVSRELKVTEEIVSGKAEKLGGCTYEVEERIVLKNEGPGTISRVRLRVAMITTREPYQEVEQVEVVPDNYKEVEDVNGNTFAVFEFSSVEQDEEIPVVLIYQVWANKVSSQLSHCEGTMPEQFLEPEPFVECNDEEIVALATQLGGVHLDPCENSRAFYDWIGDNISYTGYHPEDRGALFALQNKGGDCSEFSYLMIALCRAGGIPARFVEGITCGSATTGLSAEKHDWMEFYLPGIGWVPADPTWGRREEKRDAYFARMSSDHIIVTVGDHQQMSRLKQAFHYYQYLYWWNGQEAKKMSHESSWEIRKIAD